MQRPVLQHVKRLFCLMGRRPDLLCGAIALSCALIVALRFTCSRAKDVVMPARPPVHFFSSKSPVVDLFRGQLDYAEHIRQDSEITVLFLYAPWCGQSISARSEIEQVANRLSDQVLFVAVNCWWHQGMCRKHKSFYYFPVINLYHRSFGPIEYKGPLTAAYIEKFVRRVMSPLLYIPSLAKLKDFLSNYEPGVLGFFEFNASPQPPGYMTFFISALHSLQKDYVATIRYGVITNRNLAKEISLAHPGSVFLQRHLNSSLVYPNKERNFTAANICDWALDNRESILKWLRPHGGKSLLLDSELKKGPALFIFISYDPLSEEHPLLDEIADLVLDYNRCTHSLPTEYENMDQNPLHLAVNQSSATKSNSVEAYRTISCCNTVILPQWYQISKVHNVCELCVNQTIDVKPTNVRLSHCNFLNMEAALDSFYLKEHDFMGFMSNVRECSHFQSFYSPFNRYTACCQTIRRELISSFLNLETSNFALASHWKKYHNNPPHILPHIEEKSFLDSTDHIGRNGIDGLKCRTNKTLNLYLLDSNLSWFYAQRLGASSGRTGIKTFATIVDLKDETHYILDPSQPLLRSHLEAFIWNFSKVYNPLQRHHVGDTTSYASKQQMIVEVTSNSFKHVVLEVKKDVLLLYYTTWCGFCASLNHIFLRLAHLLATDGLVFARLDITSNDLPWEFMVDRVPTILFFPQNRKDQSVKYPEDQQITLSNLLRFILKYAPTPSAVNSSPASCPEHYNEDHISYLEKEILRLRAEIEVLHKAQQRLAGHISEAKKDVHKLKVQKHKLEQHNNALEIHKEQLQALYHQKAKEVGNTADKLKDLAAASQRLLAENALLKIFMESLELKNKIGQGTGSLNINDGSRSTLEENEVSKKSSVSSTMSTLTLDQTNESRTD